jgi:hypothetical protein
VKELIHPSISFFKRIFLKLTGFQVGKMTTIEKLADYLEKDHPFPALSILESGLVCGRMLDGAPIPHELIIDLGGMYEEKIVANEIKYLSNTGVLKRSEKGLTLNSSLLDSLTDLLNEFRKNMKLSLVGNEETAGAFIRNLISYLSEQVPEIEFNDSLEGTFYEIDWQKGKYRLQTAISPAWLPAVAHKLAEKRIFLALIGPYAAQNWSVLHKYYVHPQFRDFTACFDPWYQQKMNISKGGLLTYFDWFFRDIYGLKFFIPQDFSLTLHNFGLLRYNDEK